MGASERGAVRRAAILTGAISLLITAIDCGEFAHTNPFDPAVPVTVTVTGPDSAFAQYDTLHFAFTTDPAYDYADVEWQLGGLQKIDNDGTYRVGPTESYNGQPVRVTVAVRVDSRVATKTVDVVFPPAGIRARRCGTDTREALLTSLGAWVDVCVSFVDARGGIISTVPIGTEATTRVLDTTVAKAGEFSRRVQAVGNGSSAVVYTYGSFTDTLTVTVRQAVARVTVSPTACTPVMGVPLMMDVGDTLRLALGAPAYDAGSSPIADAAAIQSAIAELRWELVQTQGSTAVSVTPDGLVTALGAGYALVGARFPTSPSELYAATCNLGVR